MYKAEVCFYAYIEVAHSLRLVWDFEQYAAFDYVKTGKKYRSFKLI